MFDELTAMMNDWLNDEAARREYEEWAELVEAMNAEPFPDDDEFLADAFEAEDIEAAEMALAF